MAMGGNGFHRAARPSRAIRGPANGLNCDARAAGQLSVPSTPSASSATRLGTLYPDAAHAHRWAATITNAGRMGPKSEVFAHFFITEGRYHGCSVLPS